MVGSTSSYNRSTGSASSSSGTPGSLGSSTAINAIKWSIEPFYHGDLRPEFCNDVLLENGDFLIRRSLQSSNLTVSVRWDGAIRHFQADYDGQTYSLGGEKEFTRFDDLIFYHWSQNVPIGTELGARLRRPIARRKSAYTSDDVEIICKLGGGNFGDVFKVKIKSENRFVAMKTLRESVSKEMRDAFVKEMEMMSVLNHENIVRFVGMVKSEKSEGEIRILLELVNQGSLDKLLAKKRLTDRGKTRLMLDVARGIEYLHRHQIIHRDLAARNVLVHREDGDASSRPSITAKVSDFGLSRKDDSGRGYTLRTAQKLPLKWLAPECFSKRLWTLASDVWSFGVVMWEIVSDGQEPYGDLKFPNAQAMSAYITGGGHPSPIQGTPEDITRIMEMCWTKEYTERPKMDRILIEIERYHSSSSKHAGTSASKWA